MYVKSVLLQSLLLNFWQPQSPQQEGQQMEDGFDKYLDDTQYLAPKPTLTPIPDHNNYALMSRFIVHNANWTSIGYISHQKGSEGRALADMVAVSDGPVEKGSGVPYFYVTMLEYAVSDLLQHDAQCSLMFSLAMTDICNERNWDPEDPRCAHVVFTGTFKKLDTKDEDYQKAKTAVFERHPYFKTLPPNHGFFLAKYDIRSIQVQDYFGGPVDVPVDEYFAISSQTFGLQAKELDYYQVILNGL